MGFINSFKEWKSNQNEKRLASMQAQGICPDCYGKGVNTFPLNEYYLASVLECPGCNGSGSFADWSENTGNTLS